MSEQQLPYLRSCPVLRRRPVAAVPLRPLRRRGRDVRRVRIDLAGRRPRPAAAPSPNPTPPSPPAPRATPNASSGSGWTRPKSARPVWRRFSRRLLPGTRTAMRLIPHCPPSRDPAWRPSLPRWEGRPGRAIPQSAAGAVLAPNCATSEDSGHHGACRRGALFTTGSLPFVSPATRPARPRAGSNEDSCRCLRLRVR